MSVALPAGLTAFQAASLAFTAGSTVVSAIGQKRQADAEAANLRYNAAIQRNNQIIANRNADDAIKRGKIEEQQNRLRIAQLKGEQRARTGSSGILVDQGSALDLLADTAEIGEYESQIILNNAEREASGFRTQASNYGSSAINSDIAADNTQAAGLQTAGTTLISGAGRVADSWYRYKEGL